MTPTIVKTFKYRGIEWKEYERFSTRLMASNLLISEVSLGFDEKWWTNGHSFATREQAMDWAIRCTFDARCGTCKNGCPYESDQLTIECEWYGTKCAGDFCSEWDYNGKVIA